MNKAMLKNSLLAALLAIGCSSSISVAAEAAKPAEKKDLSLKELGPTKEQQKAAADRAQQAKDKKDHEKKTEASRPKSDAEKKIDKIPKKTEVKPIPAPDGKGAGVQVTIPTK